MTELKSPREARTRDQVEPTREAEEPTDWVNPRQLMTPTPRAGMAFRWIRTAMMGQPDSKNVSSKLREGWRPCAAEQFPEFASFANESTGHIEYGGLMLCYTSQRVVDQRNAHYKTIAQNQIVAVDNNMMRESDPRMPLSAPERSTRESFGRG